MQNLHVWDSDGDTAQRIDTYLRERNSTFGLGGWGGGGGLAGATGKTTTTTGQQRAAYRNRPRAISRECETAISRWLSTYGCAPQEAVAVGSSAHGQPANTNCYLSARDIEQTSQPRVPAVMSMALMCGGLSSRLASTCRPPHRASRTWLLPSWVHTR